MDEGAAAVAAAAAGWVGCAGGGSGGGARLVGGAGSGGGPGLSQTGTGLGAGVGGGAYCWGGWVAGGSINCAGLWYRQMFGTVQELPRISMGLIWIAATTCPLIFCSMTG